MELINLFKILYRKKWMITIVTVVSVVAAGIFSLSIPHSYRSTAQLATGITDQQTISLSDNAEVNNYFSTENKFSNLIENIKSRQVTSLLSYRIVLHDLEDPKPFRPMDDDIKEKYNAQFLEQAKIVFKNKLDSIKILSSSEEADLPYLEFLKDMRYDNKSLMQEMTIYRVPSTDYIKFEFVSEDPKLSAFTVNTLCKEFIRYYVTVRSERSTHSVEFLSQLADDKKKELDEKVNALKDFKFSNEVVNLDIQSQSVIDQIRELEVKREEERKKIMGLEQANKRLTTQLSGQDLNYLENQTEAINASILDTKNKIARLNEKLIEQPGNSQWKAQLEDLRKELQDQIRSSTSNTAISSNATKRELVNNKINNEVELEIAQASYASLGEEVERLRSSISGFASKEAQISALEREISVAQDAYLGLLDKLNSARLTSRNVGSTLSQVALGYPADDPVKSKKILLILLTGAISCGLSVVTFVGIEFFNRKPKTPQLLEEFTRLKPVGYLNKVKPKLITLESLSTGAGADLTLYRENLRKIRHEIESSGAKILLFSSLSANEGKTSVMMSLAYAMSLNMKKVLLIDTNFKHNRITRMYAAKPMLEKYVTGSSLPPEALVSGTAYKGIDVIGCEGGAYSPSEAFAQISFQDLLDKLSTKYQYIFLEGAPLLQYADTKELMPYADRMIHVFDASLRLDELSQDILDYLKNFEPQALSVVLNKVDPKNL